MVVASVPPAPSRCRWVASIGSGWIPKAALEQHPWKKKDGEIFEGTMTILKTPKEKTSKFFGNLPKKIKRHDIVYLEPASQAEVPWHFSRASTRATAARDGESWTSMYRVCKAACPKIDGCSILQSVAIPILTHDKYVICVYLCIYILYTWHVIIYMCIYIYIHTVTRLGTNISPSPWHFSCLGGIC